MSVELHLVKGVKMVAKEIAVYIGEDGKAASIDDRGIIAVFSRNRDSWEILREKLFAADGQKGLAEPPKNLVEILDFLGECRIFSARSVTGTTFFELDRAGCSIWEFDGYPSDFLDYILIREERY